LSVDLAWAALCSVGCAQCVGTQCACTHKWFKCNENAGKYATDLEICHIGECQMTTLSIGVVSALAVAILGSCVHCCCFKGRRSAGATDALLIPVNRGPPPPGLYEPKHYGRPESKILLTATRNVPPPPPSGSNTLQVDLPMGWNVAVDDASGKTYFYSDGG